MTNEESDGDDTKVERDHPQTRKAEPDARGSARWNEEVEPPSGKPAREKDLSHGPVGELAREAEALRSQAAGAGTGGEAFGSGVERDVGSGTAADRGDLGGGEPKAEEGTSTPLGTRRPGGESRE